MNKTSTRLLVWVQREKSKWESRGRTTGGRHPTALGGTSLLLGSRAIAEDNDDDVVVVVEGATFALAVGFRCRQRGVTLHDGEESGDGSNVMRDLYSSSCESVGDGGRGVRRARALELTVHHGKHALRFPIAEVLHWHGLRGRKSRGRRTSWWREKGVA
ncbi:hypothetical protein K438DRAFT_1764767 [Mycena galopus ATCC 62051]|nr:hypothetical protein K438DRAFT_1764767 [Mycena galopus ATCC 62051]